LRERLTSSPILEPAGGFKSYDNPDLQWAKTAFLQPQVMIHDRYLWDRDANKWTVDLYLDDLEARYGGIDVVLVWQGYTNLGLDDRNNFDLMRSLPGGLESIKTMVADFHRRGVKVFWPYYPWDQGTRNEGAGGYDTLTTLVTETDSDGMNGDTCDGLNVSFYAEGLLKGKGLVLEAQSMGTRGVATG
jgi:hypothetical protein